MAIQSVQRAASILRLFSLAKPRLGISEISRLLGLSKGTVQGLVRTLTMEGFLQQDPETRKYQLGLQLYELGSILAGSLEINQRASNEAHQLAKRTQLTVYVAIVDCLSAMVTLTSHPRSVPFHSSQLGPRVPLYCTALGKALLAFLQPPELDGIIEELEFIPYTPNTIAQKDLFLKELEVTRQRGYSVNREEHFLARSAIGAPIFGRDGRSLASICLAGNSIRILGDPMEELVKELKRTALEISRGMGYFQEVFITPNKNRS
jgi:IclR family KDG regulon transcriptional repressor